MKNTGKQLIQFLLLVYRKCHNTGCPFTCPYCTHDEASSMSLGKGKRLLTQCLGRLLQFLHLLVQLCQLAWRLGILSHLPHCLPGRLGQTVFLAVGAIKTIDGADRLGVAKIPQCANRSQPRRLDTMVQITEQKPTLVIPILLVARQIGDSE